MIFRLGVALMLASSIPWLLLLVVPVLPWSLAARGTVAGVLLASAELLFWLGVAAAGRETWRAAKRAGWRRLPGALWRMLISGRAEPAADVDAVVEP